MNYTERESKTSTAFEALPKVLEAGEKLGYWTALPVKLDGDGQPRANWRQVVTPAGHLFNISTGGWRQEGSIHASLAAVDGLGRKDVHISDVRRYQEEAAPEAYASAKRPPETIAKDLFKRVVGHPVAVEYAQRMVSLVALRKEHRAALLAHVAALEALGYQVHGRGEGVDASECYQVTMYRDRGDLPVHQVRVTYCGHVTFEASTLVTQMGAVLAAIAVPTP